MSWDNERASYIDVLEAQLRDSGKELLKAKAKIALYVAGIKKLQDQHESCGCTALEELSQIVEAG